MSTLNPGNLRLRRAYALVVDFDGRRFEVVNFLQRQSFRCNGLALEILGEAASWRPAAHFFRRFPESSVRSVARAVAQLVECGALVIRGSEEAADDAAYNKEWAWGTMAGLFHFGVRDSRFHTARQSDRLVREKARRQPATEMYAPNPHGPVSGEIALQRPRLTDPVLAAMHARRTVRGFTSKPLTLDEIGTCLFAGLRIVGFYEHDSLGRMPLKMTPSGGARNPFEAYVYARRIDGLARGIYHYSALDHSLAPVLQTHLPRPSQLLSGQRWADEAAAIVFLVADFGRTMWKYDHPRSYRVVVAEAGHIAQNVSVAAARLGLAADPTMSIQDSLTEATLDIAPPLQSPLYALSLGRPDPRRDPMRRTRRRSVSDF